MSVSPRGQLHLDDGRFVEPSANSLRLRRGDVLFNNTNSPAWVGKTAVVECDIELAFSNHMTRIRLPEVFSQAFLAAQLHFLCGSGYFREQCKKHVNQASISRKFLSESTPIVMPPANEQNRIVLAVDALQERSERARSLLDEVGELVEQLRQSVLHSTFNGTLTADWRAENPDVEPASELLARIRAERRERWEATELAKFEAKGKKPPKNWQSKYKEPEPIDDTNLPDLPQGWCWAPLPLMGEMGRGKSRHRPRNAEHLYGGPYPFVQTGDVAQATGYLTRSTQTYSEEGLAQSKLWREGTVCITIAANIASSAILTFPACFPDSVVGIVPDDSICPGEFIEFFIRTAKQDLDRFAPATAQKNINLGTLEALAVPLPPKQEMTHLVFILQEIMSQIEALEAVALNGVGALDQLDRSILAKAFRGELVPQDPNDEPAIELIAKMSLAHDVGDEDD